MPCFYLTPKHDDFNQELQVCLAEALYDVDSIDGGSVLPTPVVQVRLGVHNFLRVQGL